MPLSLCSTFWSLQIHTHGRFGFTDKLKIGSMKNCPSWNLLLYNLLGIRKKKRFIMKSPYFQTLKERYFFFSGRNQRGRLKTYILNTHKYQLMNTNIGLNWDLVRTWFHLPFSFKRSHCEKRKNDFFFVELYQGLTV